MPPYTVAPDTRAPVRRLRTYAALAVSVSLANACANIGDPSLELASAEAALRKTCDDCVETLPLEDEPRVRPVVKDPPPVVEPDTIVTEPAPIVGAPNDVRVIDVIDIKPTPWPVVPLTGRASVISYASGQGVAEYWQSSGTSYDWPELTDVNDRQIVGDFMGLGYDQVLFVNYYGGKQRLVIADYASNTSTPRVLHSEDFGASTLLDGWDDDDDWLLAGDFLGLGHDQLLAINRGGAGGLVMIADFRSGPTPRVRYLERWDSGQGYVGWLDDGEEPIVGDFMALGHDQVMFFNRGGEYGRVMIQDFSAGAPHRDVRYFESWGDSPLLDGWNDYADRRYAGDFLGLGFDQVLFLNRFPYGGRVMVADFRDGRAPAEVRYWENYSDSTLLNGWHDDDDWAHAGDFMNLGRDQLLLMNRSGEAGRVLIADFGARAPAKVRYHEAWGASTLLNGFQDDDDTHLAGRFRPGEHASLLMFNNAEVAQHREVRNVTSRDALVQALNSHFTGTLFVPSTASIDLTGLSHLTLRSGVSLVGTRNGLDQGALLYTNSIDGPYSLFVVRGNDVRISGLRFRGPKHPDQGRSSSLPKVNAIEVLQSPVLGTGKNVTITDNELWAFTDAAVAVHGIVRQKRVEEVDLGLPLYGHEQAGLVWVAHNFMHHNAREGAGYGVNVSRGAVASVFGNVFDYNRHAVASDGAPFTSYIAQHNYVLSGGYTVDFHDDIDIPYCASYWNQHFDVHGTGKDGYGGVAGAYFDISHNTVRGEQDYCFGVRTRPVFMLRGEPMIGAYFHDNAVVHDNASEAVHKKGGDWSRMFIGPNQYDVESSEDIAVGDFDGDGRADVFLATGTSWFYSSGGVTEWRYLNASSLRVKNLAFADIDNDGKTDVLSRQSDDKLYSSSGGTGPWTLLMANAEPIQNLRFHDFNGDGFTDIFWIKNAQWWIWDGKTKSTYAAQTSTVALENLRFGEFDGVKGVDVVAAVNGQWSYSSGARLSWARLNRQLLSSLSSTLVADVDGDGRPDIVTASGGTWLYSKSGQSEWITLQRHDSQSPYASLNGALWGDFDGDKRADVLRFERVPKATVSGVEFTSGSHFVLSRAGTAPFARWSWHAMR